MLPIDSVRAYWNARPCNVQHSDKPIGTAAYFEEVRARKFKVEPHLVAFADFPAWKDKLVLDAGCGIGTIAVEFARYGARVVGVDISDRSIDLAKVAAKTFDFDYPVVLRVMNLEQVIEYMPPVRYDLIWSFGVLHHTPNPELALRGLRWFANEHTTLRIMVYHRWSLKALRLALTGGIRRQSEAQSGCPITHVYSRREVSKLLAHTGWQVRSTKVDHIFSYTVNEYKCYQYRKHWLARTPFFRWLEKRFGWHLMVEAGIEQV